MNLPCAKHQCFNQLFGKQQGFTLLEVMIAVALVAIALPAFLFSMAQISNNTADTTRDSIAYWIASNQMAIVKLEYELNGNLLKGESSGQAEMGKQRWDWKAVSQESELPGMWRLTVQVNLEGSESPVEIVGFIRADENNQQRATRN